ncbi:hypothetical protein KM043_006507 [Ampulex compressa]|nr:hypothetical protein KM043_006507 [Ampulex compressa]
MKVILSVACVFLMAVAYCLSDDTSTSLPLVKCPEENSENATLIANPYNCNTYFVCETGTPIPMKCPKGLHFNAELSVCDYPNRANCHEIPKP